MASKEIFEKFKSYNINYLPKTLQQVSFGWKGLQSPAWSLDIFSLYYTLNYLSWANKLNFAPYSLHLLMSPFEMYPSLIRSLAQMSYPRLRLPWLFNLTTSLLQSFYKMCLGCCCYHCCYYCVHYYLKIYCLFTQLFIRPYPSGSLLDLQSPEYSLVNNKGTEIFVKWLNVLTLDIIINITDKFILNVPFCESLSLGSQL